MRIGSLACFLYAGYYCIKSEIGSGDDFDDDIDTLGLQKIGIKGNTKTSMPCGK